MRRGRNAVSLTIFFCFAKRESKTHTTRQNPQKKTFVTKKGSPAVLCRHQFGVLGWVGGWIGGVCDKSQVFFTWQVYFTHQILTVYVVVWWRGVFSPVPAAAILARECNRVR